MTFSTTESAIEINVFARTPVIGQVKKRLARTIGENEALRIYSLLLIHTIEAAREAAKKLNQIPSISFLGPDIQKWLPQKLWCKTRPQSFDNLTDNLMELYRETKQKDLDGILVIGSDHPMLNSAHITKMVYLLDKHPVSIGPSEDGGFWSLGSSIPLDNILKTVPMSRENTFEILIQRLQNANISYGIGPTLWDIDTESSLLRWQKEIGKKL